VDIKKRHFVILLVIGYQIQSNF